MMSLNSRLREIAAALSALPIQRVCHYHSADPTPPRLVWSETGEEQGSWGDNAKAEQAISLDLDYFTQEEFDEAVDAIQSVLAEISRGWQLISAAYEEETGLIHYHWEAEVT